jgi:hypothetical protein
MNNTTSQFQIDREKTAHDNFIKMYGKDTEIMLKAIISYAYNWGYYQNVKYGGEIANIHKNKINEIVGFNITDQKPNE